MHDDNMVCWSDDDGLKYNDKLLKSKYTAKDKEHWASKSQVVFCCGIMTCLEMGQIKLDHAWTLNLT